MDRVSPKPVRFFDPLLELVGLRLLLWVGVCVVVLRGALFVDPHKVSGHYDEHYFFARDDIARITFVDFGQLPAWNPYFCGGAPNAANPQDQAFAPDFLLRIVFGTGPGRHLALFLFVMLGLEGTYRLARRHGTSALGAATAALAFAVSGRFFFMVQFGWLNMFGFELLPWAILGYERARRSLGHALLGGGAVAWMLLNGGTYTVPFTALALSALALWDTGVVLFGAVAPEETRKLRYRLLDPWIALAKVGAIAGGLSAVKLFPMLEVIREHPRIWEHPAIIGPIGVLESLVVSHGHGGDYASESYIGLGVLLLAAVPLFFGDRGAARPLALTALFGGLSMGNMAAEGDVSLYGFLHLFPIYGQLRNPERYTIVLCLFVALALGRTVMLFEGGPLEVVVRLVHRVRPARGWVPGRIARTVLGLVGTVGALAIGLAVANDLARENNVKRDLFVQDAPLAYRAEFRQSRGNRWDAHVWPRASLGTLLCFEENPFPQSDALRGDLAAEERGATDAIKVQRRAWTPNVIVLDVDAAEGGLVLVNQNWHVGWTADVGQVVSERGLLAVRVPAGHHTLTLRFKSRALTLGLWLSVATIALLIGLAARGRRKARAETASPTPSVVSA